MSHKMEMSEMQTTQNRIPQELNDFSFFFFFTKARSFTEQNFVACTGTPDIIRIIWTQSGDRTIL